MAVKSDCFAYIIRVGNYMSWGDCDALNELVCDKEDCPFYKKRASWLRELKDIHGTIDLNRVLRDYAKSKVIE